MNELRFLPGPRLVWQTYPMKKAAEVADRAHEFLNETVALDPAVTLADVLALVASNPVLLAVYRRDFISELCEEAAKGALPDADTERNPTERLEYLELYSQWHVDSHAKRYDPQHRLHLHGVGPVLEEDAPNYGRTKGQRIQWGISCANLRSLLPLPVRVNTSVSVQESNLDAHAYGREIDRVELAGVSLGQVIHGLLWELSFHGGPQQTQEFNESLREQVAEIEAGTAKTVPMNDLFDDLHRSGCKGLFETIGEQSAADVAHALRDIADEANATEALKSVFGDEVVVREEFRGLAGREFRAAFRKAEYADKGWLKKMRERAKAREGTGS